LFNSAEFENSTSAGFIGRDVEEVESQKVGVPTWVLIVSFGVLTLILQPVVWRIRRKK